MKTYTVCIQTVEHYSIEVQANDENQAEEYAWRLFPNRSADYGENNVVSVTCEGEPTC